MLGHHVDPMIHSKHTRGDMDVAQILSSIEELIGPKAVLISRVRWFESHQMRCVVSLSKILYSLLIAGLTQETSWHD